MPVGLTFLYRFTALLLHPPSPTSPSPLRLSEISPLLPLKTVNVILIDAVSFLALCEAVRRALFFRSHFCLVGPFSYIYISL